MVRHIVLFKLKDPTSENINTVVEKLTAMRGKIEGLLELEVGVDFLHSARSCDIALLTTFDSRASLEAYQTHPLHLPVKEHMAKVRESSVAADYEF